MSTLQHLNKEQVFEFFKLFSLLEFGLKSTNYAIPRGKNEISVKADLRKWKTDISKSVSHENLAGVKTHVEYLSSYPTKRQVIKDGKLDWEPVVRSKRKLQITEIVDLLITTRNNLFHGGKYPSGPVDNPERNNKLISACSEILRELIKMDSKVYEKIKEVETI